VSGGGGRGGWEGGGPVLRPVCEIFAFPLGLFGGVGEKGDQFLVTRCAWEQVRKRIWICLSAALVSYTRLAS